jgi:hypothetical protein
MKLIAVCIIASFLNSCNLFSTHLGPFYPNTALSKKYTFLQRVLFSKMLCLLLRIQFGEVNSKFTMF